jgi:hypothetical protein
MISMRRFEAAATAIFLLYVLHLIFPSFGHGWAFAVLGAGLLAIACHAWLEGHRWQMVPAYFLAGALPLYEAIHLLDEGRAPVLAAKAIFLLALATVTLCTIMPVFQLPVPSGPYKIGTESRYLVDESRSDPFSDRSGGRRELIIQIWYPADAAAAGRCAPYREKSITTFRSSHFALVKSHSILGAKIVCDRVRFPLLLYTPSWSGIRTESTALVEELVSHGYVVVGIDHPYSSNAVAFPDGTIARRKFVGSEDYSSPDAFEAFVKTADEQIAIRTKDARFVLDTLERLDAKDPEGLLTGRLDFARVGIFGSSLGGGTSAEVCSVDCRFKAGVDLGGMISTETSTRGRLLAPFLFMFEGMYEEPPFVEGTDLSSFSPAKRREIEFSMSQFASMKKLLSGHGGCWMTIKGIKHVHFFDSPFFTPLRSGARERLDIISRIRRYTLMFFNNSLTGSGAGVLRAV